MIRAARDDLPPEADPLEEGRGGHGPLQLIGYLVDVSTGERLLSAEEHAVIMALLAQDFPGAGPLRAQVPFATVTGGCGCGCATVDLRVREEPHVPAAPVQDGMLISATVRGRNDGVLLFTKDGRLSCLEVYSVEDEPASLPRPEDLFVDRPDPGH